MPGPRKVLPDERFALSKLLLKMKRDAERRAHRLQLPGDVHLQLLGFDHARPGDQEERLRDADLEAAQLHAAAFTVSAACWSRW